MIKLGIPSQIDKYYIADDFTAMILHKSGFIPEYKDDDCLYFKKNQRLIQCLLDMGIDV